MLSNDNGFMNTYPSKPESNIGRNNTKSNDPEYTLIPKTNPFDQRTLFARFKINDNSTSG